MSEKIKSPLEAQIQQLIERWRALDKDNRRPPQTRDPVVAGITLSAAETYCKCADALAALLPGGRPQPTEPNNQVKAQDSAEMLDGNAVGNFTNGESPLPKEHSLRSARDLSREGCNRPEIATGGIAPPAPEDARIAEIRQREQAATKGPWRNGWWSGRCHKPEHGGRHPGAVGENPCVYDPEFFESDDRCMGIGTAEPSRMVVDTSYDELVISTEDAEFIAHAREDIPYLLNKISELAATRGSVPAPAWQPIIDAARRMLESWEKETDSPNDFIEFDEAARDLRKAFDALPAPPPTTQDPASSPTKEP